MNEYYNGQNRTDDLSESFFESEPPAYFYASTGQRFANYIVDLVIAYIVVLGVVFALAIASPDFAYYAQEHGDELSFRIMDWLMTAVLFVVVYSLIEGASKGRTLGKLITNTVAVREDGSAITWKDAWLRSLSRIVPFEALSGFSGHPWHDTWTKTMVVKKTGVF